MINEEQEQDEIHQAWAQESESIGEFNTLWQAYLDELELHAQAKQDKQEETGQRTTVKVVDGPPLFTVAWKVVRETRWHYYETKDYAAFMRKYLELHRQYVNKLLYELLIRQEM